MTNSPMVEQHTVIRNTSYI